MEKVEIKNDWAIDTECNGDFMFINCKLLQGGEGTIYNSQNIDKTYAHIDGGTSNPGYFTRK